MALEIERRFLVTGEDWRAHVAWAAEISQGYLLSKEDGLTVRVRVQERLQHEQRAWLTIKAMAGPGMPAHARLEFDYPIPLQDAHAMLQLAPCRVDKRRHGLALPGGDWIVDVFSGENAPLVIAEVELNHPEDVIVIPPWCCREVTGDHRLSNAALSLAPFQRWNPQDIEALGLDQLGGSCR